ncbi:DUF3168 domain-containing protein [Pigmentiphaga kullae]|uniref:Uncharacterized protein DUF3168 n=1 Tax=Pigmentiphaga kullae TaxID=151784 RepID=A0A4Q7NCA5_9BURK|nr:DUF3168 domain-containing protein [Pigmentiphaga kullae]RZS80652.1 uncharacterized protein DUF3168 [Pigmentiphaga kullae]
MEVEQALREALIAAVGNDVGDRVFPDSAPYETPTPYVVYSQVGGTPVQFVEGDLPDKRNGRWQINVWDVLRDDASRIARRIELALVHPPLLSTVMSSIAAAHDEGTDLRGTRQDFSIWF